MGEFVLVAACKAATRWPAESASSVNLSPAQFARGDVIAVLHRALDESRPAAAAADAGNHRNRADGKSGDRQRDFEEIRAIGARVALDDFGSGYSSLSYLQTFALDEIKIDRAFIAAMETQRSHARNRGADRRDRTQSRRRTVAEGIETQSQLDLVLAAGCSAAQGYFFSRPKPIAELDFSGRSGRGRRLAGGVRVGLEIAPSTSVSLKMDLRG